MAFTGFSVLAWVKDNSSLLTGVSEEAAERIKKQLLRDFCCLLNCRWNMDVTIKEYMGRDYAFGTNPRITASERTIGNAIGTLTNHVAFIRSTSTTDFENLAEYRICKEKWQVPDQVSDGSYGWGATDAAETSNPAKRKRY